MRRYTFKLNCFIKRIYFCFVPVLIIQMAIYSWICFWQSPSFRIEWDVWQWIMHLENQTQITIDVGFFLMCDFSPHIRIQKAEEEEEDEDGKKHEKKQPIELMWIQYFHSVSLSHAVKKEEKKTLMRATMECPHYVLGMHCRWTVSAHACWRDVRMT